MLQQLSLWPREISCQSHRTWPNLTLTNRTAAAVLPIPTPTAQVDTLNTHQHLHHWHMQGERKWKRETDLRSAWSALLMHCLWVLYKYVASWVTETNLCSQTEREWITHLPSSGCLTLFIQHRLSFLLLCGGIRSYSWSAVSAGGNSWASDRERSRRERKLWRIVKKIYSYKVSLNKSGFP